MIILQDGWVIDSDQYQYILGVPSAKTRKGKEGKWMKDATYHPSVERALLAYIRQRQLELVGEKNMSLGEALESFRQIERDIRAMVAGQPPLPALRAE